MKDYVFGANILENLTTGMYQDSKVIYREYIQNACDQIDKAVADRLMKSGEGEIKIWLDSAKRNISVEDNATGIRAAEFQRLLGNIADSDKKIGEDKGFRGIGRLCGLAYCNKLVFTSKAPGENIVSIMVCDAIKMRALILENEHGKKHTASEVLNSIYSFDYKKTSDINGHWFKVEMLGINEENIDLLDFSKIKEYLSFVAPVPYQNTFIFRTEVYNHAKQLKCKIDEYKILLNGETILKKYNTNFKTSQGDDEIFNIAFKEIFDKQNNLLAWLWIGVSHFQAVINKSCPMRGLRLRKENIQIGNDDALQKLFKEDRGHHYFVGEVFALAKDLIPNSQRDYFNENSTRLVFEQELRKYFNDELHRTYYDGSELHSAYKKIDDLKVKEAEFQKKEQNGEFVNEEHLKAAIDKVEKARIEAEKAQVKIENKKKKANEESNAIVSLVIKHIEKEREHKLKPVTRKHILKTVKDEKYLTHRVNKLTSYTKKEQKLISKIWGIILHATDEKTAETIIKKIEDELR